MMLEGRSAIGYDHGYDARVFYLELALDPHYVKGFVEGCVDRIGEDSPEDGATLRGLWEDGAEKNTLLDVLKGGCEVRPGKPHYF